MRQLRQDLHAADSYCLPWNEAYYHSLSQACLLLLAPCWEDNPNWATFFRRNFHKKMILLELGVSTLLHAACMQIRAHGIQVIINWFQLSAPRRFWLQCSFSS